MYMPELLQYLLDNLNDHHRAEEWRVLFRAAHCIVVNDNTTKWQLELPRVEILDYSIFYSKCCCCSVSG